MYKNATDGMRQIHMRIPADVHRHLKVMAAESDRTVNELLIARVINLVLAEDPGKVNSGETTGRGLT